MEKRIQKLPERKNEPGTKRTDVRTAPNFWKAIVNLRRQWNKVWRKLKYWIGQKVYSGFLGKTQMNFSKTSETNDQYSEEPKDMGFRERGPKV